MNAPRMYLLYGLIVFALLGLAEYRGWSFLNTHEEENVPMSVRDNPGAYRSHYYGSGRYSGGK